MNDLALEYAVPHTDARSFPILQPDDYQPKSVNSTVRLLLNGKSIESLDDDAKSLLDLRSVNIDYTSGLSQMYEFSGDTRWVILGYPKIFAQTKNSQDVPAPQGTIPWAEGMQTVAKVLLAAVVGDRVVLSVNGTPQIFTLKLSSKTTEFIFNKNNPEHKTILRLNTGLQKHYKASGRWLTQLVSTKIQAFAEKRSSSKDVKLTSMATGYRLAGDAQVLPKEQQAAMFHLINSVDFLELVENPFGRSGMAAPTPDDGHPGYTDEDICF